ncbi:MAG TPA: hypothetical protein VGZ22_30045 [Isosphaeraceae bacterium]|nr:hypothetical protein [Isosphaeraceae bacterium]
MMRKALPWLFPTLLVGLVLGGLLVGYEPVRGDPDTMYRPIKAELARTLQAGGLPFWSDHFGLGVPLVAESHVAAFYPLNLVFYRVLDVCTAYRLAMWLHHLVLVVATYAYARTLSISPWGSALSALAFALCGFQASHSGHEPFYCALAYLPLALLVAERYLASGRIVWLPLLALLWAAQVALGHFQLQTWTGGLVFFTGLWRVVVDRRPWWRAGLLAIALSWGAAIIGAQLVLTSELSRVSGFDRPVKFLSNYSFPPANWAQLALPWIFMALRGGPEDPYWRQQQTTGTEACCYVGTATLILACIGFLASRRERALAPWKWLAPLAFALATMPRWSPEGYALILNLPGIGYFRAPGRYTVLTSLSLCLLAGRGLDRAVSSQRFRVGFVLALAFGAAAAVWSIQWVQHSLLLAGLGGESELRRRLIEGAVAWGAAIAAILAWRQGRVGSWAPIVVTAVELGFLFYQGPTVWGWSVPLPAASPVLTLLKNQPDVGLIAGAVKNIPVRVGLTPAFPYLGITPPPPNYLLEAAETIERSTTLTDARWMRRFGVSHGIWPAAGSTRLGQTLYLGPDEGLDRLMPRPFGSPAHLTWRLVRYPDPFPPVHVARRVRVAKDWFELYPRLSRNDDADTAWYLAPDLPIPEASERASSARILEWDGLSGKVEHDGSCELVIRRTYYPGWTARLDDGPARPVHWADGGLQGIRLVGSGTTRVTVQYHPTGLVPATRISAIALAAAVGLILACLLRMGRDRRILVETSPS